MKLIFVHGWSVTSTDTYGGLPEVLATKAPEYLDLDIVHIYLSKYISFHDEVIMEDISRAFERARLDEIGDEKFSCITHSTGGPVIRNWIELYYGAERLNELPLKHLIMLAPANHGSALAQLGKSRLGRIKSQFKDVEPGEKILNWLELASRDQWGLNFAWLSYKTAKNGFYPVVLTGQSIDKKIYDHLNAYTGERGSDGVIRVCAANMNYRYIKLVQNTKNSSESNSNIHKLEIEKNLLLSSPDTPLGIVPNASHSGKKKGIMNSVSRRNAHNKPVVKSIIQALQIDSEAGYHDYVEQMRILSNHTQGNRNRYSMFVFYIHDDRGNAVNDYDLFLLGGKEYDEDSLPKGFFVDRQRNKINQNCLTYYLNSTKMTAIKDDCLGFRIVARPKDGFSYYTVGEFRSENMTVKDIFKDNQTTLVEIELKRHVDVNVFWLEKLKDRSGRFKKTEPEIRDIEV